MKAMLVKLLCKLMPMVLLKFFVKNKFVENHQYPESTLIHRRKAKIVYEIEFNWYDAELLPISIVREVHSGKTFSVNHYEMYDFKEFEGRDRSVGNTISDNYSKEN